MPIGIQGEHHFLVLIFPHIQLPEQALGLQLLLTYSCEVKAHDTLYITCSLSHISKCKRKWADLNPCFFQLWNLSNTCFLKCKAVPVLLLAGHPKIQISRSHRSFIKYPKIHPFVGCFKSMRRNLQRTAYPRRYEKITRGQQLHSAWSSFLDV